MAQAGTCGMDAEDEATVRNADESGAIGSGAGGVRELMVIALPMVASHACETVMMFTDRLFLARLGPELMNAAMAGGLTCFMLMTFFVGMTGYTTALVAQNLGAGRTNRCALAASQAMLISLAAWPLIFLARPLVHLVFRTIEVPHEQLVPQLVYFDILVAAVGIGLLRNCLSAFFSGIGRTRVVMLASLTSMVVNVAMNYVLIFGKLGLPSMGIRGAAYGTVLGGVAGLSVLAVAYLSRELRREFEILRSFRFEARAMGRLIRFGYPAGLEMTLNVLAFNAMILTFHTHGPATATATTIMFNWDMVSFLPLLGMQVGVMSLVGRYMGAGRPDIAHRSAMSGLKTGWMYSAVVLVMFAFFPHLLVAVFQPSQPSSIYTDAVPIAVFMIRLAAMYVLIESVVAVLSGALRGAGDTFWAMCISVGLHWSLVPIVYVTLHVLELSPQVAWTCLVATFMLGCSLFFWRYRGGKWRTIRMVDSDQETGGALLPGLRE